MPVSATWRTSLRVPDLGTSLHLAGAAPSRILFERLFCASRIFLVLLLLLLLIRLLIMFVLKRRTTIKEELKKICRVFVRM